MSQTIRLKWWRRAHITTRLLQGILVPLNKLQRFGGHNPIWKHMYRGNMLMHPNLNRSRNATDAPNIQIQFDHYILPNSMMSIHLSGINTVSSSDYKKYTNCQTRFNAIVTAAHTMWPLPFLAVNDESGIFSCHYSAICPCRIKLGERWYTQWIWPILCDSLYSIVLIID